jgi:phospholipase/carboxylesterase
MPGIADITSLGVAADRAKVLCIFVHGRNQSPEEMETAVIRRLTASDAAYVLPRALDKCWYNALAVDARSDITTDELGRSLSDLRGLVGRVRGMSPGVPLVLAGFSQGACLALEHAFGGTDSPDAVVAFTGCRVGVPSDARPTGLMSGLPVYLSAGGADPWIPLHAFAEAVTELGRAGAKLRADVFPGRAHEVCDAEVAMLDRVLSDMAAGRTPAMEAPR